MNFNIIKTIRKRYPIKIRFKDGLVVPVPDQYNFPQAYIRTHGCSLAAFYMALRFCGKKKSLPKCLSFMQKHCDLNGRAKYSIRQIYDALLTLCPGQNFYKHPTRSQIKESLKAGCMVIFEERNPTHTAVYLQKKNDKIHRFSNGAHKVVTLDWIVNKRNSDSHYKGCIIVRR